MLIVFSLVKGLNSQKYSSDSHQLINPISKFPHPLRLFRLCPETQVQAIAHAHAHTHTEDAAYVIICMHEKYVNKIDFFICLVFEK